LYFAYRVGGGGVGVSERLEIALVRELEIAYSSATAPAAVEHASPYQWASACHELFEAGRIDILEHAVRHLHANYPDLTYLKTLQALFTAVPRHLSAPLAFCDEPSAEIQIVRRPDCSNVLLCFCTPNGTLGLPINFMHLWLGRLPTSLAYIKDIRNVGGGCGYPTLGPDRASAVAAFRRIADEIGAERIYTLGVSLGGYAAMYYGLELRAEAALNIAGPVDLTPDFVESLGPIEPHYVDLLKLAPDYAIDLRDRYASVPHKPRVLIAYNAANPRDRRKAERMAGMPNVELFAFDHVEQNVHVLNPIIWEGKFLPLVQGLMSET
jgi:hypothetical protein